jgi:hypothetical protein
MSLPATIRILDKPTDRGEPGDVFPWREKWNVYCPKCGRPTFADHCVTTTSAAGKLTFSPSLVCPAEGCGCHFNIIDNAIRYV